MRTHHVITAAAFLFSKIRRARSTSKATISLGGKGTASLSSLPRSAWTLSMRALEARDSHFGARHSQPLADPTDRILEGGQNCWATPSVGDVNGVSHNGHDGGWINSEALGNSPFLKLFPVPNILTDRSEATSFKGERLQALCFGWLQPCAFGGVIDRLQPSRHVGRSAGAAGPTSSFPRIQLLESKRPQCRILGRPAEGRTPSSAAPRAAPLRRAV